MFNGAGKFSTFPKMHLYFYSRYNSSDMGKIYVKIQGGSEDPPCPFLGAPMKISRVHQLVPEYLIALVLFIHTSDYLGYFRRKQTVIHLPTPPENVTTLTYELQNFFF